LVSIVCADQGSACSASSQVNATSCCVMKASTYNMKHSPILAHTGWSASYDQPHVDMLCYM